MYAWMLCIFLLLQYAAAPANNPSSDAGSPAETPTYTADGRLEFPAKYREWIYLTSGVDMSYSPNAMPGHSMFDNVFVNPDSYRAFLETGKWPDKTMLVLEVRGAGSNASINKSGHFQTPELMGREVHVKDTAHFPDGGWAFFGFDETTPSKQVPKEAACYSCHQQHAAVDTTFVQFYPTLIDIARAKSTLSPSYLKEENEAQKAAQHN
jgi:Cytochrome P460